MLSYKASYQQIEDHLENLAISKEPAELYEPIRYILSNGGKRIRPCLALMAHGMYAKPGISALNVAAALEVFHNFTLLHDDIMDKADVRRGRETVHIKWNDNVAILSGDAMMILAYQLISKAEPRVLPGILEHFNKTALEVCEGQQYDMNFENSLEVSVDDYLKMIRLKTAVLLAASLAIGAYAGGAPDTDVDALYQFGINIGLAFQLQDDYLDVFANSGKFGKAVGGDIIANKKTFLLISALNHHAESRRELTQWILTNPADAAKKVEAVTAMYRKLHIDKKTLALSEDYFARAQENLNQVSVHPSETTELKQFVEFLSKRQH